MEFMSAMQKNAFVIGAAIVGGFLGSAIHGWTQAKRDVVRAARFELIDGSGKVLSFWGPDDRRNIPDTTPKGALLAFMDPSGTRRCEIGTDPGSYSPGVSLYGKDGEGRVELGLAAYDNPILMLRNGKTWRIKLGTAQGDAPSPSEDSWGLQLRSHKARASIGAYRWYDGTYRASVDVTDEQGRDWKFPPDLDSR